MSFQSWYLAAGINVVVTGYTAIKALQIPDTFLAVLAGLLLIWVLEGAYSTSRPSPAAS